MKIERLAPLALAVLLLSGCVAGTEPGVATSAASPSVAVASPTPSGTSSSAPEIPEEPTISTPADPAPEADTEPPAGWSDDELIGACKVAWNESGRVNEWREFTVDALVEERNGQWYVAFTSDSGSETRACTVSGSPSDPAVTLAS